MKTLKKLNILTLTILALATTGYSQQQKERGPLGEEMAEAIENLELTDEQTEAIKPILEANREERKRIFESHGIERGKGRKENFAAMRKARPELQALKKQTHEQLATILSEEQMTQLEDSMKSLRKQARDKAQSKRKKAE